MLTRTAGTERLSGFWRSRCQTLVSKRKVIAVGVPRLRRFGILPAGLEGHHTPGAAERISGTRDHAQDDIGEPLVGTEFSNLQTRGCLVAEDDIFHTPKGTRAGTRGKTQVAGEERTTGIN